MKPRIVFVGTPAYAVSVLAAAVAAGWDIPLVITQPDKPAGRGRDLTQSAVAKYAAEKGLTLSRPAQATNALPKIEKVAPDAVVVAAYGQILSPGLLKAGTKPAVNLHASLLPKYRGASPIQAAILAGDEVTGVTLMEMEATLDTGPIVATRQEPVRPTDTAGALESRLGILAGRLLTEELPRYLDGSLNPRPQDESNSSMTHRLTKPDGEVDWQQPAAAIERRVRAMQPWPGARAMADGQPLEILEAKVTDGAGDPGSFLAEDPFSVATGQGALAVSRLKPAGKQAMDAAGWLRGYRGPKKFES